MPTWPAVISTLDLLKGLKGSFGQDLSTTSCPKTMRGVDGKHWQTNCSVWSKYFLTSCHPIPLILWNQNSIDWVLSLVCAVFCSDIQCLLVVIGGAPAVDRPWSELSSPSIASAKCQGKGTDLTTDQSSPDVHINHCRGYDHSIHSTVDLRLQHFNPFTCTALSLSLSLSSSMDRRSRCLWHVLEPFNQMWPINKNRRSVWLTFPYSSEAPWYRLMVLLHLFCSAFWTHC